MEREPRGADRRLEPGEDGLHPGRDDLGVGAELAGHHDDESPRAVDATLAEARLRGLRHPSEIAEAEHGAILLAHDGGRELLGIAHLSFGADREPLVRLIDHAAAADAGGACGRVDGFGDADAMGPQPLGIELHLDLAHLAAEHRHLRHARAPRGSVAEGPSRRRSAGPWARPNRT